MVHLGDESNDLWWSIYDGSVWRKPDGTPGNERIPGQKSKAPPAMAAFGRMLYMVHLGDTENDLWWSMYSGSIWQKSDQEPGDERIPDQSSKAAPAMAGFALDLHMVHLGNTSNNIWYSTKRHSLLDWSPNVTIGQSSRARPSMASFFAQSSAELHMTYLASSGNRIFHTELSP
jgi:hypothetical protein